MESKNRRSAENSERSGICDDVKVKFPLYVFPETMQKIDMLYEADNCKSKTEFIEKAIRFYCGYLLNKDSVAAEYAAPQITAITEGYPPNNPPFPKTKDPRVRNSGIYFTVICRSSV